MSTTFSSKFAFRTVNGVKRDTISLDLPKFSIQEVLDAGEKSIAYLQEMLDNEVIARVREILTDNSEITGADNFPFSELTWEKIYNQPAAERKGRGIPKEVWDDFVNDFVSTMSEHSGKAESQIKNVSAILKAKLQPVKFNKPVLTKVISDYLAVYANATVRLEEFAEVVEFLQKKAEEFLSLDQESLADAL